MRLLLFLILFVPSSVFCQDTTASVQGFWYPPVECEYHEHFTEWTRANENEVDVCKLEHNWEYARRADVNAGTLITTLAYCPCGCPGSYTQARICRNCRLHEIRTKFYTFSAVKSEYMMIWDSTKRN